ncbi:MAG: hypothetical protein H7Y11_13850 [Armatimonadetes bacterium]|nr:hypothetical protein [Anaerolineae bacterium]
MKMLLLANAAATLLMTGVIWLIQVVHYPLFDRVGAEAFRTYEAAHTNLITCVVLPLMLIELLTAILLVAQPIPQVPPLVIWVGLGLVGVVWLTTAFVQVPLHGQLAAGFDVGAHQALVASNWVRTIAWSLRSGLMIYILYQVISVPG